MALSQKNIVITPNIGQNADPNIIFQGANSSINTNISLISYPDSNGTLSFEASSGQLFSISNDLTNSLFSVNDISGLPLIEVNVASQQITMGQFYGNVGIGTSAATSSTYKLDVAGSANISLPTLQVAGQNVIAGIAIANTKLANTSGQAGATFTGNLTTTGSISDSIGSVRNIPVNNQTAAYLLTAADAGKFISLTTANVFVPTLVFSAGQVVSVYNNSAAVITITQNTGVTMYLAGTATTGNRSLAQRGVATILCVAANTFAASGAGLS